MVKVYSPWTKVECPICGVLLARRLNKTVLVEHLKSRHPNKPRKQILEALCFELKQGIPANIDECSDKELADVIEHLCQYKSI